jgi:hypothetical protein
MALALARRTVPPGAAALLAHTAVEAFRATNRGPEAEAAQREILPRLQPALEMARPEPTAPGGTARGLVQLAAPEVLDDRGNACMVAALWAGKGTAGAHDAALRAALQFAAAIVSETPPGALRPAGGPPPAATIDLPASLLGSARSRLTTREGRVHDLLDALETAALHDVLGALLQALVEEVPDRFVWHHRKAAFHRDRGDLEAALEETRRATGAGFGDNRLRAAQRQAEILRDLGRRADALATVEDALSTPAPSEGAVRTHRYRAALESLRVQLLAAP